MTYGVSATRAPAIGDIRRLGPGDVIELAADAVQRNDWPRIWDAVGIALVRGAVLRTEE